jgi:hypothetical protein
VGQAEESRPWRFHAAPLPICRAASVMKPRGDFPPIKRFVLAREKMLEEKRRE